MKYKDAKFLVKEFDYFLNKNNKRGLKNAEKVEDALRKCPGIVKIWKGGRAVYCTSLEN